MTRLIKIAILCWMTIGSIALYADPLHCTGTVTDSGGTPIVSAPVSLYVMEVAQQQESFNYEVTLLQQTTSDQEGHFTFEAEPFETSGYRVGVIVVDHAPLALGWANWEFEGDTDVNIVLGEPASISGVVVTKDDEPIAEADVQVFMLMVFEGTEPRYLTGKICPQLLTGLTDAQGRFGFERIPANAQAEFLITKPGRATVMTYSIHRAMVLNYRAGQEDIRIVQPIEATIAGQVVDSSTGQGIEGIQLTLKQPEPVSFLSMMPVTSKSDGTFTMKGLPAGHYTVETLLKPDQAARWAATSVPVEIEEGQTLVNVQVEMVTGGMLEVIVTSSANNAPVEGARVSIRDLATQQWLHSKSDETGLAQIRLKPGAYELNGVYKKDYRRQNISTEITIADGQTLKQSVQLGSQPTIKGTVTDPEGHPLAGVKLQVMPVGHQNVTSDDQGHFMVTWDPRQWGPEDTTFCLVARHEERNLGVVVEIDEDQTEANIQLKPGLSVTGQIIDSEGEPIAQGKARVMLRKSHWGSSISDCTVKADHQGQFTIKALPPEQEYSITALAEGYGKSDKPTQLVDVNLQMDLGTFTLPMADLSISGRVVDVNDEPIAGASIYAYGENQPDRHNIKSDDDGYFMIEQICAGRIRLNANVHVPGQPYSYGSVQSEGGASDVIITVSDQGRHQRYVPRTPKSMMGKTLPDLSQLHDTLANLEVEGHPLLLCFWDMEQRPARRCLIQLAQQAESLQQQGVKVIAIQTTQVKDVDLNAWIQKQQIPFTSVMMTGDVDKTKFAWGVKALPWMVLTNQDHQVIAEGFPLRKLKENLAKVENSVEKP